MVKVDLTDEELCFDAVGLLEKLLFKVRTDASLSDIVGYANVYGQGFHTLLTLAKRTVAAEQELQNLRTKVDAAEAKPNVAYPDEDPEQPITLRHHCTYCDVRLADKKADPTTKLPTDSMRSSAAAHDKVCLKHPMRVLEKELYDLRINLAAIVISTLDAMEIIGKGQ